MKFKLTIEPIPQCNWGKSLAHLLPPPIWNDIRREVYERFNHTCAVCKSTERRLHCHEKWDFDMVKKVQRLAGFQCLCEDCHDIKHWGRTVIVSRRKSDYKRISDLTRHFCEVNKCSEASFVAYQHEVHALLRRRGRIDFKVDFGSLSPEKVQEVWEARKRGEARTTKAN